MRAHYTTTGVLSVLVKDSDVGIGTYDADGGEWIPAVDEMLDSAGFVRTGDWAGDYAPVAYVRYDGETRIENLERGVNGTGTGWTWEKWIWSEAPGVWNDMVKDWRPGWRITRQRTDSRYQGLWTWLEGDARWNQVLGHLQYHLPEDEAKALAKIKSGARF